VISFRRVSAVGKAIALVAAVGGGRTASDRQAHAAYMPANAVEHELTVVMHAVVTPQAVGV